MAINKTSIINGTISDLKELGFDPDAVIFKETGKSAIEWIIEKLTNHIINEITSNGEVSTTVATGIAVQVDPNTGLGATTSAGAGTGGIS